MIEYPHPLVERVLAETYGIMVYQEQVMQAAQVMGGYTPGRRRLAAPRHGQEKTRRDGRSTAAAFAKGAAEKGISAETGRRDFRPDGKVRRLRLQQVARRRLFAAGLPHRPGSRRIITAEFFCANMTVEMDNTDKLKVFTIDARANGLEFLPPDINQSDYRFTPNNQRQIRYALGAVKGTGEAAVEAIVAARQSGGPFQEDLLDFCERVGKAHINKRTVGIAHTRRRV